MQIPVLFRNRKRLLFWVALGLIGVLALAALGAAFQDENSQTILSVPSLWLFGLIVMPILVYVVIIVHWSKSSRFRK